MIVGNWKTRASRRTWPRSAPSPATLPTD